jgi:hypothetical protein
VEGADSIWLDTSNAGASTSVTVNVYPYLEGEAEAVAGAIIHTATISNTVKHTGIVESGMPYIAIGAINSDGSNAASLNAFLKITWK